MEIEASEEISVTAEEEMELLASGIPEFNTVEDVRRWLEL
jgi:hypothetical protein